MQRYELAMSLFQEEKKSISLTLLRFSVANGTFSTAMSFYKQLETLQPEHLSLPRLKKLIALKNIYKKQKKKTGFCGKVSKLT